MGIATDDGATGPTVSVALDWRTHPVMLRTTISFQISARRKRMNARDPGPVLHDAKALVVGIANEHSIACGCARAFRELGADLTLTYLNDKAKPHAEPLWTGSR